jgi:hypothetical protein
MLSAIGSLTFEYFLIMPSFMDPFSLWDKGLLLLIEFTTIPCGETTGVDSAYGFILPTLTLNLLFSGVFLLL